MKLSHLGVHSTVSLQERDSSDVRWGIRHPTGRRNGGHVESQICSQVTGSGILEQGIVCPLCSQPFILTYTDTEWNKLNEWRRLASAALRNSHMLRHEGFRLELVWKMKHKR